MLNREECRTGQQITLTGRLSINNKVQQSTDQRTIRCTNLHLARTIIINLTISYFSLMTFWITFKYYNKSNTTHDNDDVHFHDILNATRNVSFVILTIFLITTFEITLNKHIQLITNKKYGLVMLLMIIHLPTFNEL